MARDVDNVGRGYAKTIVRTERMMIRCMCGVKLRYRKASLELLSRLDRVFQMLIDVID